MANKKISALDALGTTPAVGDIIPITDISGTPTTKSVTVANLMLAAPVQPADIANFSPAFFSIVSESATARTLSDSDNGKVIVCSSSSDVTITIPTGLTSGFKCTVVQSGTGTVSIGGTATIHSYENKTQTAGQYASFNIIPIASDTYVLDGEGQAFNTYSVSLDGIDDYITSSATLGSTSQTTCTYSAWIKTSNTSSAMTFFSTYGAGSGSSTKQLDLLRPTNGNFYIIIKNNTSSYTNSTVGSTTSGDTNICDDLWHHVALVVDGTSFKIYIDGGDAAINASNTSNSSGPAFSGTSTVSFVGSTRQIYLGKNGTFNSYYWDGKYDEVAFIRSALSDSDIRSIYNSGVPASLSAYSPFQWLRMGDNDSGTGSTITDQGSGGNNASLNNGAVFATDIPS